ncbi:MAG: BrnT family toxin [Alphaproteobacteria bacterium]|nr:BrnT family toxin [Alphaproteobacteria bacterium]
MFEWDERKRASNLAKHGIDFKDAATIFGGVVIEAEDDRHEYGERRIGAFGETRSGDIVLVLYTWRNGRRRIISARRAGRDEVEDYRRAAADARQDRLE